MRPPILHCAAPGGSKLIISRKGREDIRVVQGRRVPQLWPSRRRRRRLVWHAESSSVCGIQRP